MNAHTMMHPHRMAAKARRKRFSITLLRQTPPQPTPNRKFTVLRIVKSCMAPPDDVQLRDVVIGMSASTNSAYASQYRLPGTYAPTASWSLISAAVKAAQEKGASFHVGNIFSSDTFYDDADSLAQWQKMGVLAIEMEAAALYMNAARAGKNALCILTVSDCPMKGLSTSAEERQTTFRDMMEIALETAYSVK